MNKLNLRKNCKLLAIFLSVLLVSACGKPEVCIDSKIPDRVFIAGDKATHIRTNEDVRVTLKWGLLGGGKCEKLYHGLYTVRFSDGAEIVARWTELKATH